MEAETGRHRNIPVEGDHWLELGRKRQRWREAVGQDCVLEVESFRLTGGLDMRDEGESLCCPPFSRSALCFLYSYFCIEVTLTSVK